MRSILFKAVALLILAASLVGGWLMMDYRAFLHTPLAVEEGGARFVVKPGTNLSAVAHGLARQGLLDRPRYFVLHARLEGVADSIQAGEYAIAPGTTPSALLQDMVAGRVIQYSLTLVEGWTFRQVMDAVRNDPYLTHTLNGLDDAALMARLGHPDLHPEGRFFPDTYRFPRGTTDVAFLQRAFDAMHAHLAQEWAQRDEGLPLKTPYEALILASIVEKETALPRERRAIAGVFVRRLQKGMRLQTDPTVIYGLGAAFDGNLHRRDLRRDDPYNTYRHRGLPPTPIAMPGLDSLHAALHPAPGDALYFVSKGDGSHAFSATLEEHNRAVVKYQLNGRARPFSSSSGS